MKKYFVALGTALLVLLTSCGGGDGGVGSGGTGLTAGGVGSGGTGISSGAGIGPITGFGSIFVNGVHYDISNAAMTLDDATSLQLGMTVKVEGTSNADFSAGTASRVVSAAELRGPVSVVNLGAGTLEVQGSIVTIDPATVFGAVSGLSALAVGDSVQIYGLLDAPGSLRASRIEKLGAAAPPVVSGSLANLAIASNSFRLGNLTVNYGGASFVGGLTSGQLADGVKVRVRSATHPVAGVLQATQIQAWHEVPQANGTAINLTGVISNYASLNSFRLLGTAIDASTAQITGGPASAIGNGVKVEVSGYMSNGILVVGKLKIKHIPGTGGPASFNLVGAVGAYVSPASFRVQGHPVDASGAGVVFSDGSATNLANGAKVTIVGSQVVNGVLLADTVTFNP
ncbi:DUF5666 domain-containing protein [Rhodoferax sp.]|uniref:DUF5666 domain-containing protein n=1 Tax=Rhodoferax sp. TaxID=50421 RepID=UPI002717CC29|nr:DUF5666 domain-containing protein [Rhodoferax sp.]MDO9198631.1 DUF5666 domain-containing protein [Rhodoferax sp.]